MNEAILTPRFRIEVGGIIVSTVLLVLTLVRRAWIEAVFGIDPDQHSGVLEELVVVVSVIITVTLILLARREWQVACRVVDSDDRE